VLWRIRPNVKVVPVPPPVRKINSKGTAVLNARRAGNRGQIQVTPQDYSRFWLTPQTPTPKSAKTRLVRARARGTPSFHDALRPGWHLQVGGSQKYLGKPLL
jgi:hypothetical protein